MCFTLYAGTNKPLPRKKWTKEAPDICVESLTERDETAKQYFSLPEVQYIGSTSGCGCDFPHVMFQNGDWPWFDDGELDPERDASDRHNREGLANLLRATGEQAVELYGVWDGDFDFTTPPAIREEILLDAILDPAFRFKEQGFYLVCLT